MRTSLAIFALAIVLIAGCATDQTAEIQRLEAEIAELRSQNSPLPASLANYFPPKAEAPLWLIQMHNMATPLTGTVNNVMSGDMEKAIKYFDEFKEQFVATSKMVPEWTSKFDMGPVAMVEERLAGGDPEAIMAGVGALAGVCHNCHYENMVDVQLLYLWPRFSDVKVDGPEGGELSLPEVMRAVEGPLVGVGLSLREGSPERAREQLQGFKKAVSLLEEACEECHETERTYFVDESVHKLIDRLEGTLADPSASPEAASRLLRAVGQEMCYKCHLVHLPAAITQKRLATDAEHAMGSH